MIDSEFCRRCGRPYAMHEVRYCDSCIKDMLYEDRNKLTINFAKDTPNQGNIAMKKEKYYYIRDNQNRPIITICLLKYKNRISRGVAICSTKDQPCKKTGRAIAKTRASFASTFDKDSLKINRKNTPLICLGLGFYKAYCNPKLTEYEQRLFYRDDKINEERQKGEEEESSEEYYRL